MEDRHDGLFYRSARAGVGQRRQWGETAPAATEPLWVFADQLGPHVHGAAHRDREVVLVESTAALTRRRYHRQKLHLVLSGLRHLAAELGDRARYFRTATYRRALDQLGTPVVVHEPTSFAAVAFVEQLRDEGLVAEILPSPTFALSKQDFAAWAGDRTRFRMADFYQWQRQRFGVLLEPDGAPVGGRWSYDTENRDPPPKGAATLGVRPPWTPQEDDIDARVRRDLDEWAVPSVGLDGPRQFAVTRREAGAARRHFLRHRLATFGRYEDAILTEDWAMAHSLLSVPLNLGLLEPLETAQAEYIWHLYWHLGPAYRQQNALSARQPLPEWFAELDADSVTAACLRTALARVRDRGWVHHIQRLMVLGNHACSGSTSPTSSRSVFRRRSSTASAGSCRSMLSA